MKYGNPGFAALMTNRRFDPSACFPLGLTALALALALPSAIVPEAAAAVPPTVRAYGLGNQPGNMNTALLVGEHAIADLDGDGYVDVVHGCSSTGAPKFSILFNRGDGTFEDPVFRTLPAAAPTVTAADLDGDGDVDLAFARWEPGSGNQVFVFANNGNGVFPTSSTITVGARPRDIGSADLDLDGDIDLVTVNELGTLTILRNSGTGSFTPTTTNLPNPNQPAYLDLGDLDGDGRADLTYTEVFSSNVHVLFNSGGSFPGPVTLLPITGNPGYQHTIGDVDDDGDNDVVHARSFEQGIPGAFEIFENLGSGTFAPGRRVATTLEYFSNCVDLGDVDADGVTDVVASGYLFDMGAIAVVRGLGGGTFAPAATSYSGRVAQYVSAVDVDGNGRDDIVSTNVWSQAVKVFLTEPDGSIDMLPAAWFNTQFGLDPIAGDLDNDGDIDALVAESSIMAALLNDGSGNFTRVETSQQFLACTQDIHLADLDRDGVLDLLATRENRCGPYRLLTMRGRGDGTFDPLVSWSFAPAPHGDTAGGNLSIATLDWDEDGDLDVAVTEASGCPSCDPYRLFLFDGNGNGGFSGLREWFGTAQAFAPNRVYAGDFDEDGHQDLLATPGVTFIRGLGDGTFGPAVLNNPPFGATWLALGDVNLDGHLDAAYVSIGESGPLARGGVTGVMLGDGNGGFTSAGQQWGPYDLELIPEHGVAIGDIDSDGFPDVIAAGTESCDLLVFRGDGTGAIDRAERYGARGRTYRPTVADFDGDGRDDVGFGLAATLPIADSFYSVLPNLGQDPAGIDIVSGSASDPGVGLHLAQALPVPSHGPTRFRFAGAPQGVVMLTIHDVQGRLVSRVETTVDAGGAGSIDWDGTGVGGRIVGPGVYYARLRDDRSGATDTRAFVVVR